ncbi:nucleolar protein 16-like [Daktulosphaira vitifoliae]|uniref:nucleolar protein 16-like n=1 Tax=Daktulosphaira vitifoliae TaxID=58002 RepID=UPI0021AA0E4A|nr:nucleolar protein 16-like [Daktulosphaira vitifoliae]
MPSTYNKKALRRKMKKRMPKVTFPLIKDLWDDKASVRKNLRNFGLTNDPSRSILTGFVSNQSQENAPMEGTGNSVVQITRQKKNRKPTKVIKKLEEEAKKPRKLKQITIPPGTIKFLTYLMEKYGNNYKEMTKDPKNVYQMTWKQIRAKILIFKGIKDYEYLMPRPIDESK